MDEIRIAKLINGTLIIGIEDSAGMTEVYAIQAVPQQNNPSSVGLMIVPMMMPISEDRVDINSDHILCMTPAPKEMSDKYREMKSGLTITSQMPTGLKVIK